MRLVPGNATSAVPFARQEEQVPDPLEERRAMDWLMFQDRKHGIWIALMLALVCALDGCASKRAAGLIEGLGTYTFDGGLQLSVTTRGMSLMQYEMRQSSSGPVLLRDVCGRDVSRWFLYFDKQRRLWAHSDDTGTVVWIRSASGRFTKHQLTRRSRLVGDVPAVVRRKLPRAARQTLGLAVAERTNR